jgi:hypothetical protein
MTDTSQEAFQVAQRSSRQVAYRLYIQIRDAGQNGVTRDELVQCFTAMGVDQSTVTARVRALVASGLVTDGPDRRPTRKKNPAKVVRFISGLDFKTLYKESAARNLSRGPGQRCNDAEREFLDRCHSLSMAMKVSSVQELTDLDAPKLIWDYFRELRQNTAGILHVEGQGFRDTLGHCAWCHKQECINSCVS